MGRVFSHAVRKTGVTAAVDLAELNSAVDAAKSYQLVRVVVSNKTEVGDAQEEQLGIAIKSGQTTGGSGGDIAVTGKDNLGNNSAASIETFNTTKASAGTIITHYRENWNVRQPFDFRPTEKEKELFTYPCGRRCTIELLDAPGDAIDIDITVIWEEFG